MKIGNIDRCLSCMEDKNGLDICPHCGFDEATETNPAPCLALGMQLNDQYILGRMLGHGGFGITYLAWDTKLETPMAIKEYWPRDYGQRATDGISFSCYHGESASLFDYGRDKFIEEARKLARFEEHPGIVNVHNFFEANGLPYMVMQYVKGIDLKQYLATQGDRIELDLALRLMTPILDGLRAIHQFDILHRDISPDNIYITESKRVILIDFGAAKDSFSNHSQSQVAIHKPGYSPEEQYRLNGTQGPCTDIYAAAATIYRLITGQIPPDAMARLAGERLIPPSELGIAIKPHQEAALLKALEKRCSDRFQAIADFQAALDSHSNLELPKTFLEMIRQYWWAMVLVLLTMLSVVSVGWMWHQQLVLQQYITKHLNPQIISTATRQPATRLSINEDPQILSLKNKLTEATHREFQERQRRESAESSLQALRQQKQQAIAKSQYLENELQRARQEHQQAEAEKQYAAEALQRLKNNYSWSNVFNKYSEPQSIYTPKGYYVIKRNPSRNAVIINTNGAKSISVIGYLDMNGHRFYMTQWSWQQYQTGKQPNWVLLR